MRNPTVAEMHLSVFEAALSPTAAPAELDVADIGRARSTQSGERRRFSAADKKRMVEEACRPGASVSGVARQYGIAARLLFRWKQELASAEQAETTFLPVNSRPHA